MGGSEEGFSPRRHDSPISENFDPETPEDEIRNVEDARFGKGSERIEGEIWPAHRRLKKSPVMACTYIHR
jgi:hypothetical protein